MSLSMCNDLLLLQLVPRHRIASITWLAHDAAASVMPGADAGVTVNHGHAEEILRDRPDLVLASPWSSPILRRVAAGTGARVIDVADADSFASIRTVTRQVGAAVGEPARAQALVARMDATLAMLARIRPQQHRPRVLAWEGNGAVPGKDSLADAIVSAAGADNLGARRGGPASVGLEQLLALRPDALLQADGRRAAPSLDRMRASHPLLRVAYHDRRIAFPATLYTCGLPQSAAAAAMLRRALDRLPRTPVAW